MVKQLIELTVVAAAAVVSLVVFVFVR